MFIAQWPHGLMWYISNSTAELPSSLALHVA